MAYTDKHAASGERKKTSAKRAATAAENDAIALLVRDHDSVLRMFREFEHLKSDSGDAGRKGELVQKICNELTIHTQIEEEIFYPRVRDAIRKDALLDEALVEHNGAKEMIAQLEAMEPGDELYDATVTVLGEHIRHHVREEQNELFPQVRKSDLDTADLGLQLKERKEELKIQYH